MLAKIIGNVGIYLLCALRMGMRFRSKRYLCWRRCRLPQRMVQYASSSPPSCLDIIFDLKLV